MEESLNKARLRKKSFFRIHLYYNSLFEWRLRVGKNYSTRLNFQWLSGQKTFVKPRGFSYFWIWFLRLLLSLNEFWANSDTKTFCLVTMMLIGTVDWRFLTIWRNVALSTDQNPSAVEEVGRVKEELWASHFKKLQKYFKSVITVGNANP